MATSLVLTPPVTPGISDVKVKTHQRARYKRIRFKNWQPDQAASKGSTPSEVEKRKPDTPASEQHTVEEHISETEFDTLLRRAIASHPASPLSSSPASGTRMDPFIELPIKADGVVPATLDYCELCLPDWKQC